MGAGTGLPPCRIIPAMRIRKTNTTQNIVLTVQSVCIVLLSVLCFMVAGWVLIALIRLIIG